MMSLPSFLADSLRLPVIVAPMFLASGPDLVVECCKSGVVGSFPALNQRDSRGFERWLEEISCALKEFQDATGRAPAPFAVNLVVHKTNSRLREDLSLCVKHKVPIVITSLGAEKNVIDAIHGYGGVVFHDVVNVRHARKAAASGVDGLIAVAAGAGGHSGAISPFALVAEIRQFFDKTLLLAGSISQGKDIAASQLIGADLAYMGTRFLCTQESLISDEYKKMIRSSNSTDVVYTANVSGVPANFLRPSMIQAGLDPEALTIRPDFNFGHEVAEEVKTGAGNKAQGAWRSIWSAGHGVGAIDDVPAASDLVETLRREYRQSLYSAKPMHFSPE